VSTRDPARKDKRPEPVRPVILAFLLGALLVISAGVFWALRDPGPADDAPAHPRQPLPVGAAPRTRRTHRLDDVAVSATGEPPPEADDAEPSGMKLYPPNVKPLRRGLVVPEDYVLPPGYVRHYQSNEDGTLLPPILTFHPDYQPVDDAGRPIALGPGRVVPPELAPPGFPMKTLEIPPPDFTDRGAPDGGE
jgi:hypothetical protein